jgi:Cys-rich repeat protein
MGIRRIFEALFILIAIAGCKKTTYTGCQSNADCYSGYVCFNGKCVECGTDADCGSGYSCFNYKCEKQNTAPVANAGSDISAYVGEKVYLNGCYSEDADGDKLSYVWQKVSGPSITLNNDTTCLANFVAQQEGSLEFKLRVCDSKNACSEDSVLVNIVKQITQNNNRPVALAPSELPKGFDEDCYNDYRNKAYGVTWEILPGYGYHYNDELAGICKESRYDLHNNLKAEEEPIIWLVGEARDADGDALSYRWEQIEGPTSALIFYPNAISTQVAFPNAVSGNYIFRFRVDDGKDYDYAYTKVYIRNNLRPVVNGSTAETCLPNSPCTLPSINLSYDPDGKGGFRTGILKCEFDFGDGSPHYIESQDNAPDGKFDCQTQHIYTSSGYYYYTITATDNNGNIDQRTWLVDAS